MFSKTVKWIDAFLIFIGITYLRGRKDEYYTTKYYWQAFCSIMFAVITIPQVAYTIAYADDLVAVAECFLITVTFFISFVKLACHMLHRSELKEIIDAFLMKNFEYKISLVSYMRDNKSDGMIFKELEKFLKETNNNLLRVVKCCLIVYGGAAYTTVFMQAIKPIILGWIYPETHYREFPYFMTFPWNQKKSPIYQITYVLHVYFGVACAATYVGLDSLFALLLGHIIRQLKIVGFIMSHLDELVAEVREKHSAEWERDSTILLANCAQHIVALKWYCRRLNSAYAPFLVAQAVSISGVICICMLMIAKSEGETMLNVQNLMYFSFEVTAMVQIGIYCAVGQVLKDVSENVKETVVGSWWEHSRRHQSCVRILVLAVQRPITMYIWGTIELSYATYGAITKTAVSYFTLLHTLTEK